MSALTTPWRCSGEITERAELLNGAIQLSLDGELVDPTSDSAPWTVEIALSWRLGRAGAVSLDEGDLVFASGDRELVAILEAGNAEVDADTGDVEVDAAFEVEGVSGIDLVPGALLQTRIAIGAERWSGQLSSSDPG